MTTAYPQSRTARGVAMSVQYGGEGAAGTKFRPVRVVVLAQGDAGKTYSSTMRRVYSSDAVGRIEGYGTPAHLTVKALLPPEGSGVGDIPVTLLPLQQPTSGAAAAGTITPSGTPTKTQTYWFEIGGVLSERVIVKPGDDVAAMCDTGVAAINAVLDMPALATDNSTSIGIGVNWEGASGNNVGIKVITPEGGEITWGLVQPTGGSGVPDITAALAQIGENVWETHLINSLDYTDDSELDEIEAFNEGRWDPEVRKYIYSFVGTNEATMETVRAVTDARATDRTNIVVPCPGSSSLPFVIAAEHVRGIAVRANENPACDYGSIPLKKLNPGLDSEQWKSSMRQTANTSGLSTIRVKDGVVQICDVITCWHPSTEERDAYKSLVQLEKIATMVHNFDLVFDSPKVDGVPVIPNGQATKNPLAMTPNGFKAKMNKIFDNAADDAIISDPEWAKENSSVTIDSTNADRLNVNAVFKTSGNANVISIDLIYSRYYGA